MEFIKKTSKSDEKKTLHVQITEIMLHLRASGLQGYNFPIHYQPLFSAKDHCVHNPKGFLNDNLSYYTKTRLQMENDKSAIQ